MTAATPSTRRAAWIALTAVGLLVLLLFVLFAAAAYRTHAHLLRHSNVYGSGFNLHPDSSRFYAKGSRASWVMYSPILQHAWRLEANWRYAASLSDWAVGDFVLSMGEDDSGDLPTFRGQMRIGYDGSLRWDVNDAELTLSAYHQGEQQDLYLSLAHDDRVKLHGVKRLEQGRLTFQQDRGSTQWHLGADRVDLSVGAQLLSPAIRWDERGEFSVSVHRSLLGQSVQDYGRMYGHGVAVSPAVGLWRITDSEWIAATPLGRLQLNGELNTVQGRVDQLDLRLWLEPQALMSVIELGMRETTARQWPADDVGPLKQERIDEVAMQKSQKLLRLLEQRGWVLSQQQAFQARLRFHDNAWSVNEQPLPLRFLRELDSRE